MLCDGLMKFKGAGVLAKVRRSGEWSLTDPAEAAEFRRGAAEVNLPNGSASQTAMTGSRPGTGVRECVGVTVRISNTHKPYKEARCQTRGIAKGCVWRDG